MQYSGCLLEKVASQLCLLLHGINVQHAASGDMILTVDLVGTPVQAACLLVVRCLAHVVLRLARAVVLRLLARTLQPAAALSKIQRAT